MASTNDLKNGLVLNLDGELWSVVEFQHVKPGKGGAFVRTTLKNVLSGKVVDKTFNAGTKVETANVDKRSMTYLYKDGADFVFMDGDTYDQIHVGAETVGDGANYLLENTEVTIAVHDGTPSGCCTGPTGGGTPGSGCCAPASRRPTRRCPSTRSGWSKASPSTPR